MSPIVTEVVNYFNEKFHNIDDDFVFTVHRFNGRSCFIKLSVINGKCFVI